MFGLATYSQFLFVCFSECGKKIVGDASGVGHSTGIESGPTEVCLFRHLYSPGYRISLNKVRGHQEIQQFQKSKTLNNVPFLCTKLFQKRGHYSRGDIIQVGTLLKAIWYSNICNMLSRNSLVFKLKSVCTTAFRMLFLILIFVGQAFK